MLTKEGSICASWMLERYLRKENFQNSQKKLLDSPIWVEILEKGKALTYLLTREIYISTWKGDKPGLKMAYEPVREKILLIY